MGLMEIEMAKTLQRERMAAADGRRRHRNLQRLARERQETERGADRRMAWPKVEWPVFSIRIGGFELVAFRSVKLGP